MHHDKDKPDLGRRRFLQFTASAAVQSTLPPLPLSTGPALRAAGPAIVATVSENYATFMAMSFSRATWKKFSTSTDGSPTKHEDQVMAHRLRRLSELFSFYTLHNERQILSAQSTQAWKRELINQVQYEKKLKAESPDVYFDYGHDLTVFSEDVVTQKKILQALLGIIGEILDAAEAHPHKYSQHVYDDLDGSYRGEMHMSDLDCAVYGIANNYFSDFKPSTLVGLSARQKIELVLEFSRDNFFMNPIPRHAGSRHQWFDVPSSFPPMKLLEGEALEQGMFGHILDLYREKVAAFKTLPEQFQSLYEEHFSIEEYFQRRDLFVSELDLFFAGRKMKQRVQMKQAYSQAQNMQTADHIFSVAKSIPEFPSASLLRCAAALRNAFSNAHGKFSAFFGKIFVEKKDACAAEVAMDAEKTPLSLPPEHLPPGRMEHDRLQGEDILVSIRQTPPQP